MKILPFCGTIYNPAKFENLTDIIAPPYDVITPAERRFFINRSPVNVVQLILGDQKNGDYFEESFYTDAARLFNQWCHDEILIRLEQPAIFYLHQFFRGPDGVKHLRKGFIALMPIMPYGPDTVLAHERTHKGPILDRLHLVETTKMNFSQIFFTYQDKENRINQLLDEAIGKAILKIDGADDANGIENICHVIQDDETIRDVARLMDDKPVFIADGHHRYETLRQYRDMERKIQGLDEIDANYVMGYFSCAFDVGLKVYPTHRTIHDIPNFSYRTMREGIWKYFDCTEVDPEDVQLTHSSRVFYMSDPEGIIWRLELKEEYFRVLQKLGVDPLLAGMDVVILEELIFKQILGITEEDLQNRTYVNYHHEKSEFWSALQKGDQAGWLMNYPDPNLLFDIAKKGLMLPQKSTYFFPKLPTGVVMRRFED